MSTLLPILALALALAAALLSKQTSEENETPDRGRSAASIWAVALTAVLFLAAYLWQGWDSDATHVAIGFAVGAAASVACRWVSAPARVVASLGLAATCEGLLLWAPDAWRLMAQLGAITGAAAAAWMIDVRSRSSVSTSVLPISLAAVTAMDVLGGKAMTSEAFQMSGMLMAMIACAAGVLAMLATMRGAKNIYQSLIAFVLLLVGAFVLGWRYLELKDVWLLFIGGMVTGLVVNWLVDDGGQDSLRPMIAAILWIGLATLGFGLQKGFGMSLGLLGGVSSLLLLGNKRAILTLGPLAGLVMYRVFREQHVAATRALDIGQHYALIGVSLGALVPLMPVEWLRQRLDQTGVRLPSAGVIWLILITAIPILSSIVLGPKGVVGFVAGLGFASLIQSLRSDQVGVGSVQMQTLGLGLGLAAATTFIFQFLGENTSLTRDQKSAMLLPMAIGLAVAVLVFLIVSPRTTQKEAVAS